MKISGQRAGKDEARLYAVAANETDYNTAAKAAMCEAESGEKPLKDAKVVSIKTTNITAYIPFTGIDHGDGFNYYIARVMTDSGGYDVIIEAEDIGKAMAMLRNDGTDMTQVASVKTEKLRLYVTSWEEYALARLSCWEKEHERVKAGLFGSMTIERTAATM